MSIYNDLDKKKWKEYNNIITDSLWIINKRDNTGAHSGHYHGNFIPQIPRQLLTRYTKKGDWILDPFMGSGTTLIEAQRMERNSIGIELQPNIANEAKNRIITEQKQNIVAKVITGDSTEINIEKELKLHGINKIQFVILHPPYWDILKFSNNQKDLSNSKTIKDFLESFDKVIENSTKYLEKNRYCALIIGDKYANSQIIPLGFYCMHLFTRRDFTLKAILIKNFEETKGKSNQQAIWRYRALASDFYIFKHEYIFVFKKTT